MNDGQLTAIIIVAIVMFASIIKTAIGGGRSRRRHRRDEAAVSAETAENARLRDEVKVLRDRLAVIERITVEKENSLEREIEALRDR